jgi:hypothetical protein
VECVGYVRPNYTRSKKKEKLLYIVVVVTLSVAYIFIYVNFEVISSSISPHITHGASMGLVGVLLKHSPFKLGCRHYLGTVRDTILFHLNESKEYCEYSFHGAAKSGRGQRRQGSPLVESSALHNVLIISGSFPSLSSITACYLLYSKL